MSITNTVSMFSRPRTLFMNALIYHYRLIYHEHCSLVLSKPQEILGEGQVQCLKLLQREASYDLKEEVRGVQLLAKFDKLVFNAGTDKLELLAGGDLGN
jgi:hypothetical protein